ncbi:MAG TPA: AI-2E family transporter, partial [Thermodesulfobacteriota bacterium]|nr:AI-2E family transporter [Thermodesulfobacteriota bacterium]
FRGEKTMSTESEPKATEKQGRNGAGAAVDDQTGKSHVEFTSIALKGLLIIALFYTLYFARTLFLPFTLALLLNFLLRPVVRALKKIKIPELAGAALVLIALLGSAGYGMVRLSAPAAEWIDKAPESLHQIESKVGFLRTPLERVNNAVEELKRITRMGTEKKPEVEIHPPGIADAVLSGTREVIVKSSVMFILLYFLLASGDLFLRKLIKLFPGLDKKKQIVKITREVEHHTSRYLYTVTVINIFMGISVGLAMYFIGLPNPVLWGVMAGFLVFLPYIGPLIGISVVTVVAFLTFDSVGRVLLAPAIYIALETIQGQIVTPMLLGLRFTLNPVVIFVWLIFWGWMWGIVGAMLAFPMLAIFKILCDHIEPLAPIGEFLGR